MSDTTGRRLLLAGALAAAVASCGGDDGIAEGSTDRPYEGWEERGVASLSDDDVDELLSGAGHGYALSAELNEHPGPSHVIELASELGLDDDQVAEVERIEERMRERARELGERLVEAEWHLDEAFRAGTEFDEVADLTQHSGAVEAELRAVHLDAHLETTELLTTEQVAHYDQLRGYAGTDAGHGDEGDHRPEEDHGDHGDH